MDMFFLVLYILSITIFNMDSIFVFHLLKSFTPLVFFNNHSCLVCFRSLNCNFIFHGHENVCADGELAFCCPSIGLEPESQSKFSDNSPDSMGCKSRDQKGKENEKKVSIDLKKNEGNLVPTKYDREEEDGLIESKLVSHMGITDLENDEAKVRNFVEPVAHSSQYTESPNAKRSPNVSIPDPPEELYSYETIADIYLEECVTEREAELIVCCKESNYHFIKDICVDEGVPANDKVLFENSVDEKAVLKILPFDPYENNESEKDYTRINGPFPAVLDLAVTEESDKVSAKHHQSEDLLGREENATKKLADQNKEMVFPGDKILLQELDSEQTRPSPDVSNEDELIHAKVLYILAIVMQRFYLEIRCSFPKD